MTIEITKEQANIIQQALCTQGISYEKRLDRNEVANREKILDRIEEIDDLISMIIKEINNEQ